MERPGPEPDVTPEDVLEVFERLEEPCTPLTASEVAAELDCSRRTAHRKLEKLVDRDDVNSKKTGARGRVWWRSAIAPEPSDAGTARNPQLEQFGAFINAVEDYAIFMLDPDGVVINWNDGAERIKGYDEEWIVGEHFSTFYTDTDTADGVPERNLETAATEGRVEDEGWRVRADGSQFWANVTITAIRDEDGTLQGFTKVTRDLTERREYEAELRHERDFVEQVLETVPVSVSVLAADGKFERANSRAKDRLGIDDADLGRRSAGAMDYFDEEGEPIPANELPWARVVETGEPVSDFQCQVDFPDAERQWLSINAAPMDYDEEQRVVVSVDDITAQREHEQQLRRERDQTEELLKTAPIAIAVQGGDGETLLANQRARETLAHPEHDVLEDPTGTDEWTLYDDEGEPFAPGETPWVRTRATGEPVTDEKVVVEDPSGDRFWFAVSSVPVLCPGGGLERVITVADDITELKERERQLELRKDELETEMSEILGRVSDAFYALDDEWRFTHVNDRAAELLQHPRDELLGERLWDVFPEAADDDAVWESFHTAMRTQEPTGYELYFDVLGIWVDASIYPSESGVSVYFRDATQRIERERQLAESRLRYRALVENFPNGAVALVDEDLRYTTVGGDPIDEGSATADDLEGSHLRDALSEELADLLVPKYEAALEGESSSFEREYGGRDYQFRVIPVRDDEGDVFAAMGMSQDITERTERERALEEQRERYRRLVDVAPVAIATYDADGIVQFANDAAADLAGVSDPNDVVGTEALDFIHPDDREESAERIRTVIEDRESVPPRETRFVTGDGETRDTILTGVPIALDGEPAAQVVLTDITEQKERERELAEYRRIVETVDDGVYVLDSEGRFEQVNDAFASMTRFDRSELIGAHASTVFGKSFDELDERARRQFESGEIAVATFEEEIHTAGDGTITVENRFRMYPVDGGQGRVGVVRDITARKEHERELERYRTIVQTVNDGVYTVDENGRYTMVNDSYAEMTGYSREELVGAHVSKVVGEDTVETARALEEEMIEGNRDRAKFEADVLTADGGTVRAEATFAMLPEEDREFERVGVVRDITRRVERERALEESERRYRTLVENFPEGVVALFDEDLQYMTAGGQLMDDWDVSPDDVVGTSIWDRYPDDIAEEVEPYFRDAVSGETSSFEIEYRGRELLAYTLPVRNADDEVYAGMLVVQDVTERVERERALERYKQVFDTVDDGIYILGPDFHFEDVNDAYAAMTGYAKEDLVGRHCSDVVGEAASERAATLSRELAAGEREVATLETDVSTRDGGRIPTESKFTALPSESGEFQGSVGVVRDLTERKEYERELETHARQQRVVSDLGQTALENPPLDDLFDEAVEAVAETLDTDYCKVLDRFQDGDELLLRAGVGWTEGLVGDATVGTDLDSQAGYTLRSEEPVVVEDLGSEERFNGPALLTDHDVVSGISTIIGPLDDPWGVLGTHDTDGRAFTEHDVTFVQSVANILSTAIERKHYEQHLDETIEKLEESNERLEQFAYVASHDLQEPLRMVSNYLQLLEQRYADDLDEDAEEFIGFAVDGAERMREMINDLLAYSRVDTKAEPFEPTDTGSIVEGVLDQLRLQIEENDAKVVVGDLPTVSADANQLEQVFQNLVSNALKYRGEEPPRIEIDSTDRGDAWEFRVADNGIGMDPDLTDRIFEIFQRLHTDEEYPGTGIGLALCRKIVERHGGEIWVDADREDGSTFYFTIPNGGPS